MNHVRRILRGVTVSVAVCAPMLATGCATMEYRDQRWHGQNLMITGMYGAARNFLEQADAIKPRQVENLHDLGTCCVMVARDRFDQQNHAAAMRELEAAIAYYSHALDVYPGHQPSIQGKNVALELQGQFDKALKHAEWTAQFVGPAAKQYVFLAREHEQRGDTEGALLRYRQAVAMEPENADAQVAFAKFLIRLGNDEVAVHHLQAAYRIDPTNSWTLGQLAARSAVPVLRPVSVDSP